MLGTEFIAYDTQWSPDGTALALLDKAQFCVLYEPEAEPGTRRWNGEGLTHVSEEDEGCSFLSNTGVLLDAVGA